MAPPRVLALIGDETGCTLWRVWWPFTALERQGFIADWAHKDDPGVIDPRFVAQVPFRYDAVILPRLSWDNHEAGRRYIDTLHKAGLAVIYEVDDDVYSEGIEQRQYENHDRERQKGLERLRRDRLDRIAVLQMADGVTVTTKRLATVVRQYTDKPVQIVPNAIDVRYYHRALQGIRRLPELRGHVCIGWAGGARYSEDLAPLAEAWARIAHRFPDVRFVVQGHIAPVLKEAVPEKQRVTLPWLPVDQYMRALVNVDIGCASVADRHFNRCKTPIKVWEYTLAGATVVASPTLYGPYINDGVDGMIADTTDQWESALARLIGDPRWRRNMARKQRQRVVSMHSLEANLWRWPAAWSTIIDHYQESRRSLILPAQVAA